MATLEPLIFSRCPVLPSTAGIAAQLGNLRNDPQRLPGLDIILRQQPAEPQSAQNAAAHPTRYWLRHGPNIKPLWARANDSDDYLLGVAWLNSPAQILALPESGIRTVKDLKGRRVALPTQKAGLFDMPRATNLRVYEVALQSAGLTVDDVEFVEVAQPYPKGKVDWADRKTLWTVRRRAQRGESGIQSLVSGVADAVVSHIHFAVEGAAAVGANVVFDIASLEDKLRQAGGSVPHTIVASGALVRERPDELAELLARLLRAADWAKENPAESVRLTATDLGSDEQTIEYTFGDDFGTGFDIDLDPENLAALGAFKDFLFQRGFIPHDFSIEDWVDRAPLEAARSRAGKTAQTALASI
jgi:ABC-type nitrate/sulfonate/bicarbonate transport system substrate-binding protein